MTSLAPTRQLEDCCGQVTLSDALATSDDSIDDWMKKRIPTMKNRVKVEQTKTSPVIP